MMGNENKSYSYVSVVSYVFLCFSQKISPITNKSELGARILETGHSIGKASGGLSAT